MTGPVTVALVGLGGYGGTYLRALLDPAHADRVQLVAGIDPEPHRCKDIDELRARGIHLFTGYDGFLGQARADLVVISSPIHLHAEQTCRALAQGMHVLCEKPLCSTIQDAERMSEAHRASGRHAAIGYQWSYAPAISAAKRDIMAGRFGAARLLKTKALWPRTLGYYGRSPWAGALRSREGEWVLDSPVNNATAHFLHNAFFCLGRARDASARPESVVAELYRANEIGNYDTAALRARMPDGAEVFYIASHAADPETETCFSYRFERGAIEYRRGTESVITGVFDDGSRKEFGSADDHDDLEKLWAMIAAIRGGETPACPPSAALAQTLCMNGAQESMREITSFPASMVETTGAGDERRRFVPGLHAELSRCYDEAKLPSELGFRWARPGIPIDLTNYRSFPSDSGQRFEAAH
ncbi:MAG: Gfo/Idh/MocA family oxidoreductase [Planctomycetes bacterium]|nr:Gfo/Idh/MocA family oxidoreductase [Planctomycetota bacterium]